MVRVRAAVGPRLRCGVWALRLERRVLAGRMRAALPVHLVRADVYETGHILLASRLEQDIRPHDVRLDERPRLEDRAVHMGLCGEMDNPVATSHYFPYGACIAHIPLDELNLPRFEEFADVFEVPRVRELVEHEDVMALPH